MKDAFLFLSTFLIITTPFKTFAGEIKSRDLNHSEMSASPLEKEPPVSPEQAQELKKQLEMLKEKQKESDKALKELEQDL